MHTWTDLHCLRTCGQAITGHHSQSKVGLKQTSGHLCSQTRASVMNPENPHAWGAWLGPGLAVVCASLVQNNWI